MELRLDQAGLRPVRSGFVPEGLITVGSTYSVLFARDAAGDTITRTDGGSFVTDMFAAGQTISVSGTTYNNASTSRWSA